MEPQQIDRKELFELYKIALDEYRFEVKLNWDRMQYYVALNAALLGAGVGLLRLAPQESDLLLALFFSVGILTSWIGLQAIATGQDYYHQTRRHKLAIEEQLGLLGLASPTSRSAVPLALGTTHGMRGDINRLTHGIPPESRRGLRRGSIIYYVAWLLRMLLTLNLACAGYVVYRYSTSGALARIIRER